MLYNEKIVLIQDLFSTPEKFLDKELEVWGWVRTIRDSKSFGFIELNDGSCFKNFQIIFDNVLENFEEIAKQNIGTSLRIKGKLVKSEGAKQPYEIHASEVIITGSSSNENPIQKKRHSFEYLRTIPHLRMRTNTYLAVFRVRSVISQAIHNFFAEKNFVYMHTPILTTVDAEGAGEMFQVTTTGGKKDIKENSIFGEETFLTVSGQLTVEPFCLGFRNVYTFGPTFRAENSNTARHANEFWMVEPEMAFADLDDNMTVAEDMLKYIINDVIKKCPDEMNLFNKFVDKGLLQRLENIVKSKFARITYTEAIEKLQKSNEKFEYPTEWGENLQTEHERYLAEKVFKKPVFVTDYPKDIKAFYMKLSEDGKTVRAMDLLVPGVGEIIGGSQREEDLSILEKMIKDHNIPKEEYEWYLDLRRFGTFPHSGFGLGLERAVMYLTGMKNIRDVIPYPRTPNNITF